MSADDKFLCAGCNGIFTKGWTDDEAEAEMLQNGLGNIPKHHRAEVCTSCYKKLMKERGHEKFVDEQGGSMETRSKIEELKRRRSMAKRELADRRVVIDMAKLGLKSQPWNEEVLMREEKELKNKEEAFALADTLTDIVLKDMEEDL